MADFVSKPKTPDFPRLTEMKGAPRGMLLYYILNSISTKPRHGYQILQDIDNKTEGAWRPGVGSVYPILKKLLDRGYIQNDNNGSSDNRRVYSITPKGVNLIREHGDMFTNSSQRWMAMRRLFFDMLDPAGITNMFVEGPKKQFEMTKELLESRRDALSRTDMEFMLREYSLNLERQLDWTQSQLRDLKSKSAATRLG
ncbi:MAG: PadR family transcriptional regulator [Thaumarchaeota archaeon]|nr:PadR family transcriptional regulator [Nitrososphaerota archaeon]